MIAKKSYKNHYSISEKFFLELILELTHPRTSDTYRAKYHNPKTILIELYQVLCDWKNEHIKDFQTVKYVVDEAKALLQKDSLIKFNKISIGHFKELLETAKDKQYTHLLYCSKLLIDDNPDYISILIEKINQTIETLNEQKDEILPHELSDLSLHTSYLVSELINIGISKSYIHEDIFSLRKKSKTYQQIITCILNYAVDKRKFQVYFKCIFKSKESIKLKQKNVKTEKHINKIKQQLSDQKITKIINQFINEEHSESYPQIIGFEVETYDPFTAVKLAKGKLSILFDNLKLGFPDIFINQYSRSLIIDTTFMNWPVIKNVFSRIDGKYKTGQEFYEIMLEKVSALIENEKIAEESKEKVKAAIRHLRQGHDAGELEHKFLNYWIGLEYLFSTYNKNDSTFKRIKRFFPPIHSASYIHRNVRGFFTDKRLSTIIRDNKTNPNYLIDQSVYQKIQTDHFKKSPLLGYRALNFKNMVENDTHSGKHKDVCKDMIKSHHLNLERHLARIYRIRNEIVHEAAKKPNIESIASNLRFYLTFILNSLIEYLYNNPLDIHQQGLVSIEDFFIIKEIEYLNLSKNGFKLDDLLEVKDVEEIFS